MALEAQSCYQKGLLEIVASCSTSPDVTSVCVHIADSSTNEETHLATNNEKFKTKAKMIISYLFKGPYTLQHYTCP